MEKVGRDTTQGFSMGLEQGKQATEKAIQSFVTLTVTTFKRGLKISSPSQVTAELGKETLLGFTAGFMQAYSNVQIIFAQFVKKFIVDWKNLVLRHIVKEMNATGKAITDGLAAAIRAGQSSVVQAAVAVVKAAIKAAKKEAGISSPSKEFIKIGNFMMDGLAKGLEQSTGQIEQSVGLVTAAAISAAKDARLPELALSLQSGGFVPDIDMSNITKNVQGLTGNITPGYLNNTGAIVGTVNVGGIHIEGINDPEYDGEAAGIAAIEAMMSALRTRSK